jgi:P pilus assembly chaperone PapD
MIRTVRSSVLVVGCLLLWPISTASGFDALASDPLTSGAAPSTTVASPVAPGKGDFALTVSPTRLEVGPDDVDAVQTIKVLNGGHSSTRVIVQKRNFVGQADGSMAFEEDAPYAAADWMTIDPMTFEVAPGATQVVDTTISVPAAPEPGDHQVALVFLVEAGEVAGKEGEGNIKINRGVSLPVYITVPGVIDDSVALGGLDASGFAIKGPVTLTATVRNTGTVHRNFRGETQLPIDGAGERSAFPDFTVARDSSRQVSTTWDPPLACICHLSVSVTNADGSVETARVRVVVVPLHLIGAIAGVLLALVVFTVLARRRYRSDVAHAAAAENGLYGYDDDHDDDEGL